jgi:hypothetical protein
MTIKRSKLPSEEQKAATRASGLRRVEMGAEMAVKERQRLENAAMKALGNVKSLTPHPIADCFPLDEATIPDLAKDIQRNALHEPIWLFEGLILDGRRRHRACRIVKYEFVSKNFRVFQGTFAEACAFVASLNIHRRHLTQQQREVAAAKLANLGEGRPSKTTPDGGVSQPKSAEYLGVSVRGLQRADRVVKTGTPALLKELTSPKSRIKTNTAVRIAALPPEIQDQIVAAPKPAAALKALQPIPDSDPLDDIAQMSRQLKRALHLSLPKEHPRYAELSKIFSETSDKLGDLIDAITHWIQKAIFLGELPDTLE